MSQLYHGTVSTVPHMGTVETKLRQKAPYFYELIVENINYLWVLLIDNILVYKLMNCHVACHVEIHFFSVSIFCVKT